MPGRKRPYPRSGRREIVDFARFQSRKDDYTIVCVSRSVLDVARLLVSQRGMWPTTYSTSYDDAGYTPISASELDSNIEPYIAEFLGSTDEMNCDDLITQLATIGSNIERLALSNEYCCGPGSSGAGGSAAPAQSFVDDGSTTFPTGYADRPAYVSAKCQGAYEIIQTLKTDVTYIRDASIATLAASALVAALITPVPFDDILVLSALAIGWFAQSLLTSTAQEVIDWLTNSEATILCNLYEADTVTAAMADIDKQGTLGSLATLLLDTFVNPDAFNRLFEYDQVGDYGADCSGCGCDWEILFGTGTLRTDGVQFTLVSEWDGVNTYDIEFRLNNTCCSENWRVHIDAIRNNPNNGSLIKCCPGNTTCQSGTTLPIGFREKVTRVSQVDSTVSNFEIDFRIEAM